MNKYLLLFLFALTPFIIQHAHAANLSDVLYSCNNPDNTFAYGASWSNGTHYMDNTDCKMIRIDVSDDLENEEVLNLQPSQNISDLNVDHMQTAILSSLLVIAGIAFVLGMIYWWKRK